MLENTARRLELISQAKHQKLSVAEAEELRTILKKEARHSFATGEIGVLAFLILVAIIDNMAKALEVV